MPLAQNNSVVVAPNVVKVVIYFTDGWPNIVQQALKCNNKLPLTLWNFGGFDTGTSVSFFDPLSSSQDSICGTDGGTPSCCSKIKQFKAVQDGNLKDFHRSSVTNDALYQALATATTMRTQGMYIYTIGLGNNINKSFLQQMANDPTSSTFNPNQPIGQAHFISSCPSSTCTAELDEAFQTIASQILLRLTQ